jgi:nitric-oxide synthase
VARDVSAWLRYLTVTAAHTAVIPLPTGRPDRVRPGAYTVDLAAAEEFLRMFHAEYPDSGPIGPRLAQVRTEVSGTGTYRHTTQELAYGARLALRDSGWSASDVPWRRLRVRDKRRVHHAAAVASECFEHLRLATNGGRVRPLVTVFAPDAPGHPGPCIWNEQLVRYAGYRGAAGRFLGDRRYAGLTDEVRRLGWQPPSARGRFDLLPLVVETVEDGPKLFPVRGDLVLEVPLEHPELSWFPELGLRWHTVPVISNMRLSIGGVNYPAAPFNSWFVGTEIGTRSLADEGAYAVAREVAQRLRLDTSTERTLWRDRATVELNRAVLHSFDLANVTISDHHSEAQRRIASLRSRPRPSGNRPTFLIDAEAARRARKGSPARFLSSWNDTTQSGSTSSSTGRLAALCSRMGA